MYVRRILYERYVFMTTKTWMAFLTIKITVHRMVMRIKRFHQDGTGDACDSTPYGPMTTLQRSDGDTYGDASQTTTHTINRWLRYQLRRLQRPRFQFEFTKFRR